ncbi:MULTISPECIES: SAM-dependent methyltransferase [Lacticaseibacillus]|nr:MULTISPECIES: SAM-dependent methyltransferase [Lacticaseibacillus]WFB41627.1 SAM-dependent methyltransferase [Lacticaseibacillus huelsenbergensis]WNX21722.1 SAM-dependent methyltransferase [Lacticaseibacillus paracasei]
MILVLRKNRKRKDVLFIDASDDEGKKSTFT